MEYGRMWEWFPFVSVRIFFKKMIVIAVFLLKKLRINANRKIFGPQTLVSYIPPYIPQDILLCEPPFCRAGPTLVDV